MNQLTNKIAILSVKLTAITCFCIAVFITENVTAQNADKFIRAGNKLYKDSLYEAASEKFSKALEVDPNNEKGIFNQGNAYYKQENYEEALKNYELSAGLMEDPKQRAAAYHNLGNTFFDSQKYEESIEAYKNALRQNPNDVDTKYNLMLAKKMLQDQQNQNQDQQNQDQNQENKDQENQENQNKDQNQENQDQQNQDQENQQNEDQQKDQQNQNKDNGEEKDEKDKKEQPAMSPSKLTPEEAKQLLESLSNDEKNTLKELMKKEHKAKPNKSDKDW